MELDMDSKPYVIYGSVTFSYWLFNTLMGYLAYNWSVGAALSVDDWDDDVSDAVSSASRIWYMWAFDFCFQTFMAPISIWWLLSLFIKPMFKFMFGFFNGWSLAGVFFFNFIGLYWFDLVISWIPDTYYSAYPIVRMWLWGKSLFLVGHFVAFFMYHKEYKAYYKYMAECPTNDCKAKALAKKEKEEAAKEAAEPEPVDPFAF